MLIVNLTDFRITWEMGLWKAWGDILIMFTKVERPAHCRWHRSLAEVPDYTHGERELKGSVHSPPFAFLL